MGEASLNYIQIRYSLGSLRSCAWREHPYDLVAFKVGKEILEELLQQ